MSVAGRGVCAAQNIQRYSKFNRHQSTEFIIATINVHYDCTIKRLTIPEWSNISEMFKDSLANIIIDVI